MMIDVALPFSPLLRTLGLHALPLALGVVLRVGAQTSPPPAENLTLRDTSFGNLPDGTEIRLFTLANADGLEASVMTLGATLTTVKTPDRNGRIDIITHHKNSLAEYVAGHPAMGSTVGRFANRIGKARFHLDGVEYPVTRNLGEHHLHGGTRQEAFHWQVWSAQPLREDRAVGVTLSLISPHGQAGFPGTLAVQVTCKVTDANELILQYEAVTDQPTVLNLTNHAYWNLAGHDQGEVMDHQLRINADFYLAAGQDVLPTGEILSVAREGMDFRVLRTIGSQLTEVPLGIYDHCYVLNKDRGNRLSLAAEVREPTSGRTMEVWTTQPGMQLYTGRKTGLCLETQHFPNAPNVPHFPSTVLRPGEVFRQTTLHRFGIDGA
jgi:aldose 1-epimerase